MIQFDSERDTSTLQKLRAMLLEHRYELTLQGVCGTQHLYNPFGSDSPEAPLFYARMLLLPPERQSLARLFFFDEALSWSTAQSLFGEELLAALIQMGLLVDKAGAVSTDSYRITTFQGLFFIVNFESEDKDSFHVYIGLDSYRLSNCLPARVQGKVADFGTGSGIFAILSAARGARAVGVELNNAACQVARANVLLNGLSLEQVDIRNGDLWEPVAGEKFDHVFSNPPFVPTPADSQAPAYADGGEDGLKLIERLLSGLDDVLEPGGKATLTFQIPGSQAKPSLFSFLSEGDFKKRPFHSELVVTESFPLNPQQETGQMASYEQGFQALAAKYGYDRFFNCLLFVRRVNIGEEPSQKLVWMDNPLRLDQRLRLSSSATLVQEPQEVLQMADGEVLPLQGKVYSFLSSLDGSVTLAAAIGKFWNAYGDKLDPPRSQFQLVAEMSQLALSLFNMGALEIVREA